MTLEQATVKAEKNTNESCLIPSERAASVMNRIGIKYKTPKGVMTIQKWIGQNFIIEVNGEYDALPVMVFINNFEKKLEKVV